MSSAFCGGANQKPDEPSICCKELTAEHAEPSDLDEGFRGFNGRLLGCNILERNRRSGLHPRRRWLVSKWFKIWGVRRA